MKAVIARVKHASVSVDGTIVGAIGPGILTLLGFRKGDTEKNAQRMLTKISSLRIFPDTNEKMNRSLLDVRGEHLIVPQFTLEGNCRKGNRPSFDQAASPEEAAKLFEQALSISRELGIPTQGGRFQAHMSVSLENDGPVTFIIEI